MSRRCLTASCVVACLALLQGISAVEGQAPTARIGAAITVLADGSEPWEDRPIAIAGVGVLTGTAGVADPGDDLGPKDGVVRTYDTLAVRLSYDVLDASAERLELFARLDPELQWEPGQESRLLYQGCPEGVVITADGSVLICRVGVVPVPPAVTGAVDVVARVRGSAPDGARPTMKLSVLTSNGQPDPDPVRCPTPVHSGCQAKAQSTRVSAALALETSKATDNRVADATQGGVRGKQVTWELRVLPGGDGDPRGNAAAAPGTYVLHDWLSATTPAGDEVELDATLSNCAPKTGQWSCEQPGGPGTPIVLSLSGIDPDAWRPTGSGTSIVKQRPYAALARVAVTVFYPEHQIATAGGSVRLRNYFATVPGQATDDEFRPVGNGGEVNLGGHPEPLANNRADVTVTLARDEPTYRMQIYVSKWYVPGESDDMPEVVAGDVIRSVAQVYNQNPDRKGSIDHENVIVCDAFDNATQQLVVHLSSATVGKVAAYVSASFAGSGRYLSESEVDIEFGSGPWGTWTPTGSSQGQRHFAQSVAYCSDDVPINAAGWVRATDLDFANCGGGLLDAAAVNLIRARLRDPLSPGVRVSLNSHLRVLPNPSGTLLLNYASGFASTGDRSGWRSGKCNGSTGDRCPEPPQLHPITWDPGTQGDARILVDAPTRIGKTVDGRYTVTKSAGDSACYRIAVRAGRASDFPLPGPVLAHGVVVTDVLPAGLDYISSSAVRLSEDSNGNNRLDVGEDVNGNGILDPRAPAPPSIQHDVPDRGETTLAWRLGTLLSSASQPLLLEYDAKVDRFVPGGEILVNWAEVAARGEPPADCPNGPYPWRCDGARVRVSNASQAGIEKMAVSNRVAPGEAVHYLLRSANLTQRPIEWMDAVDILPWHGDPRHPPSHVSSALHAITATVRTGPPVEVWASRRPPIDMDRAAGSLLDGVVDPVRVYGSPGAGLGGPDWPCKLDAIGVSACPEIASYAEVTALRIFAPDPDPDHSGSADTSFLPVDADPHEIELWLQYPASEPGDVFHNSWGGRFESLVLPAFDSALVSVPVPPIFLPVALREPCVPQLVSLVLVLDASSSMQRQSGLGGTKMAAVINAAAQLADSVFADGLDHEVAVVGFNNTAWVAQRLSASASRVRSALSGMTSMTAEGTRLDLGLAAGADALGVARHERRVMVFLTDGLPNRVPLGPGGSQEETVLKAARLVRASGITIYTIGYGRPNAPEIVDRVSETLLLSIAGAPHRCRIVPDAAGLASVFREIAADVVCPLR